MEMVGHDAKGYQAYLGMETGDKYAIRPLRLGLKGTGECEDWWGDGRGCHNGGGRKGDGDLQ